MSSVCTLLQEEKRSDFSWEAINNKTPEDIKTGSDFTKKISG